MMESKQLAELVVTAADDLKASDIVVLDVRSLTSITDYMVIASGRSDRQVRAIADNVMEQARKEGIKPIGVEGQKLGEWVLVDFGDVLTHVMLPDTRAFYALEKLWTDTGRDEEQEATD